MSDGKFLRLAVVEKTMLFTLLIWFFHKGKTPRYYIGGFNEWQSIDLVKLLQNVDEKLGR
jgi:dTDP-glucose 4,6-dehydratase